MGDRQTPDPQLDAAINEALSSLASGEPSPAFRARVMTRLDAQATTRHTLAWTLAAAGAAATLIAVLVLRPTSPPPPPAASRQAMGPPRFHVPPTLPPSPRAGEVTSDVAVRAERRVPVPLPDAMPEATSAGDSIVLAAVQIAPIPAPSPLDRPLPLAVPHVTADRIVVDPISVDRLTDTSQEENR